MKRSRSPLIVACCATLLGGCAGGGASPAPVPETAIVFPPLPDTARIQFLTRISSAEDVRPETERSLWQSIVGEDVEKEAVQAVVRPYGVAIDRGRLYVCDTGGRAVDIIDLVERSFEYFRPRDMMASLQSPINCFVDSRDARLYVTDSRRKQVLVYDSLGTFVGTIADGEEVRATDVFVDGDDVWVADFDGNQLAVFDRATFGLRRLVAPAIGDAPDSLGALRGPTNLYVTRDHVYVSNFGGPNVTVYRKDGAFERSVGGLGTGLGQFVRPKGIAVDRDGILYVVDAAFENVQMFDREGQLLMYFGGPYEGPGDMWLPAKIIVDYENTALFSAYVAEGFRLKYLVIVTNQFGPDKVSIYGAIEPAGESGGGD
jgi:DNA-binding beta-propeller fold protein YncE